MSTHWCGSLVGLERLCHSVLCSALYFKAARMILYAGSCYQGAV